MENLKDNPMPDNEVSVVLAVYNGEKYLRKQLDSILAQRSVTIKELIIVDDKSTDGSPDIIRNYEYQHLNIKFVGNQVNQGPIRSFVTGAKLSTAEYTAFADQDDIWLNDKLYKSLELIKKIDLDKKPAVVFSDLEMIDENDKTIYNSFWKLYDIDPGKNNFFTIAFGNIATGCTMLINRKMLNEFIDMPLNAQMHDHWIMLIASSFGTWAYLDDRTIYYRSHNNSVTNKNKVTLREKAVNFFRATLSKNPEFLSGNIEQAILFNYMYNDRLNSRAIRQLNYFIGLKNASGFRRKIISKFRFQISKWI
jgi:glycosyltransferase involved in cell wall biosynthesis